MTEQKEVSGARKFFDQALKTVKGDNTTALVEDFTAEMTLVAEGLCDDQAKLRSRMDNLENQQDRVEQRLVSEQEALESMIRENQRDADQHMDELTRRLTALEKRSNEKKTKNVPTGIIRQLTWLAAIVCGAWVIVTILNLLK